MRNVSFFKANRTVIISFSLIVIILVSFLLDTHVAELMHQIKHPILDVIIGNIGNIELIVIILVIIPSIVLVLKRHFKETIYLWLGLIYALLITFVIKLITLRERPLGSINPWGDFSTSFPSMHTAVAFTAAYIASKYIPKFAWPMYSYASLVALSRIYFDFHYFSDIVTGSILGIGIGWFLLTISNSNTYVRT